MFLRPKNQILTLLVIVFLVALVFIAFQFGLFQQKVLSHSDRALASTPSALFSESIQLVPCVRKIGGGIQAQCGVYTTPLERGEFELEFVLFRPNSVSLESLTSPDWTSLSNTKPPVIYIEGGPGSGGTTSGEALAFWENYLLESGLDREVVVFSSRGTLGAKPYYSCEKLRDAYTQAARLNQTVFELIPYLAEQEYLCIDSYDAYLKEAAPFLSDQKHPGLRLLSSHYQKEDVTGLMKALGYESWHLWGGSYGGRVALLAATEPEVVSVVLDSPYLFSLGDPYSLPQVELTVFKNHTRIYRRLKEAGKFDDLGAVPGDYSELFYSVMVKLQNAEPCQLEVVLSSGAKFPALLTDMLVGNLSVAALYDSALWQSYYRFLIWVDQYDFSTPSVAQTHARGAVRSDVKRPLEMALDFDSKLVLRLYFDQVMDEKFNLATYFGVECLDNTLGKSGGLANSFQDSLKGSLEDSLEEVSKELIDPEVFESDDLYRAYAAFWASSRQEYLSNHICHHPIFSENPAVENERIPSVPIAIFNGEMDPVTPPSATDLLPPQNAMTRVTLPNWGHGVLFGYACETNSISVVLDAHDANNTPNLDELCLQ